VDGGACVERVVVVDHAPIGRTPRSNAATYTGLFDVVRDQFAALPEARTAGYDKGRFSFNVTGGRCEGCQGAGVQSVGMHFLGSVDVPCPVCRGRRFNEETLAIRLQGKSIFDVLNMTVEEALSFFESTPGAVRILRALADLGLGYLSLGQPSTTLSGGEAQRVKLAGELARPGSGKTLFVLTEPTAGLHAADQTHLLAALQALVDAGHTLVVVDNDPGLLVSADHIVDLGPGSGEKGGRLVAAGPPDVVARCPQSLTGHALARLSPPLHTSAQRERSGPAPTIRLVGVTTNNLQGIDADFPAGSLTVVTGVSGSGKSSLAFDTLFAEGQRRFMGSLSAYAMQFLRKARKGEFEHASRIPPTVAIDQSTMPDNPRSTVATVTGLHPLLRLLYARAGEYPCPMCGLTASAGDRKCLACGIWLPGPFSAGHFSFNREIGACTACRGLGFVLEADPERLVSHPERALTRKALDGHKTARHFGSPDNKYVHILRAAGKARGIDFDAPWESLDDAARTLAMFGTGDEVFEAVWRFERGGEELEQRWSEPWPGFVGFVTAEYEKKHQQSKGEAIRPLMDRIECRECRGSRLAEPMRSVRFHSRTLPGTLASTADELRGQVSQWMETDPHPAAAAVAPGLLQRLDLLCQLGLGYLTLDREAATLSGGEARRVRLVNQVAAGLCGVAYVFDEPTIGLHPRDTATLLDVMEQLKSNGNTLVVVEHDEEVMRAADHIIDLGPGPGREGGRVVAAGPPDRIMECQDSLTGSYLRNPQAVPAPALRRPPGPSVVVDNPGVNNLRTGAVELPSRCVVAVTGVSGSGKSSLVFDVLEPSLREGRAVGCREVRGAQFGSIVTVDQGPIGKSPASIPATVMRLLDSLRKRFASTPEARHLNLRATHFSFNTKGGRCEACKGMGEITVSMDFMADMASPCEECHGQRYKGPVLQCRLRGRNIAEVLEMTVIEALSHFVDDARLSTPLQMLEEVGLGYLQLGQSATTLSGGEAQRLKLAAELMPAKKKAPGETLYLLDEPTTGLHFHDVARLSSILGRLADAGHTVVVVEHHPDVIKCADYIVDLGPEGGPDGGLVVAAGTPEQVAACEESHTGRVLRSVLV